MKPLPTVTLRLELLALVVGFTAGLTTGFTTGAGVAAGVGTTAGTGFGFTVTNALTVLESPY